MRSRELLSQYIEGRITKSEFIPEYLSELDLENTDELLSLLPDDAIEGAVAFVERFNPMAAPVVTGYVRIPTAQQLGLAREWLRSRIRVPSSR
jgi:hypothetical protein